MEQLTEDWEIQSCEIHYGPIKTLIVHLLVQLLTLGLFAPTPVYFSSGATWTVRQKSSGVVKRVTATNKSEAADSAARGLFDPDLD